MVSLCLKLTEFQKFLVSISQTPGLQVPAVPPDFGMFGVVSFLGVVHQGMISWVGEGEEGWLRFQKL